MSYNARTHITSAILGYRPAAFEHTLVDRVRASAATAHHPLMLPLCVYELYLYRMIRYIESFRYSLFSIDTALGLNKNPATGVLINRPSDDYSELSKIIVSLHESLSSGRFIHLQQMPKTLEKAVSLFESMKSPPEISSVNEVLNVRLEFLGQTLARHLLAVENYKSRIEMYSSTVSKPMWINGSPRLMVTLNNSCTNSLRNGTTSLTYPLLLTPAVLHLRQRETVQP